MCATGWVQAVLVGVCVAELSSGSKAAERMGWTALLYKLVAHACRRGKNTLSLSATSITCA